MRPPHRTTHGRRRNRAHSSGAIEHGAALLRERPGLGAGVHLVMNEGPPVLLPGRVPSLVAADGRFRDGLRLVLRYGRLRAGELRDEWRAQIERFAKDTGREPDHLDLHCHYPYLFAAWFRVSLELARGRGGLPVRLPFDDALESRASEMAAGLPLTGGVVRRVGRRYQQLVREHGLKRPHFVAIRYGRGGSWTAEALAALIRTLPPGTTTEVVAHPGTEGWRTRDFEALADPRVGEAIEQAGIDLVGYPALGRTASGNRAGCHPPRSAEIAPARFRDPPGGTP